MLCVDSRFFDNSGQLLTGGEMYYRSTRHHNLYDINYQRQQDHGRCHRKGIVCARSSASSNTCLIFGATIAHVYRPIVYRVESS